MTFLKPARLLRTLGRRHACTNSLNSFHHGPGSTMPAVDPSGVTLLNMRFCPYAQRTVLCLNAKNVDYSVINCTLKTKAEWLVEHNPLGKVPVLLHNGAAIYESLVTCDYVDEVFAGRRLHSDDPAARARDKMLVELFNRVVMPQVSRQ